MKNIIYTLLVSLIISTIAYGQTVRHKEPSDVEILKLKGKVKSITENKYEAVEKFGDVQKGKLKEVGNSYVFNNVGNVIEFKDFHLDGTNRTKETYKFNVNGKRVESNRVWAKWKNNKESSDKGTFIYDSNGHCIETNDYDEKGNISRKRKLIEEDSYDKEGKLESKVIYKYDDSGNNIEWKSYTDKAETNLYAQHIYTYNENGNVTTEIWITPNDSRRQYWKITYKYDKYNNIIERDCYDKEGTLLSKLIYKYVYDNQLNWTTKTEYEKDEATEITERTIVYF